MCYFLEIPKQICAKVPMLLYLVGPKHPSGNCYVSFFLTDRTALALAHPEFGVSVNPIQTRAQGHIMSTALLLAHPDLKT